MYLAQGSLKKQEVAGLGWSPANSPPAHGAGLSHGPAWTDGCREGHVDPKETQKPQWCLCTLWWMKFESTPSSSKGSPQPLSAIHRQPWPEATQHLGEMWGSAPLNRCWRAAALSIHRPGMDLEPGGERLPISHPKNYRFLIKKPPDFPRLCVYRPMQRIMQYRRQEDIGVCKVSEALGVTHSPAGRSQMRLLLQHKHSPHRVLPILLNSCGLLEEAAMNVFPQASIMLSSHACMYTHIQKGDHHFFFLCIFTILPSFLRSSRDTNPPGRAGCYINPHPTLPFHP